MPLTIATMPAYNEGHAIEEVILGCKKYADKVIVVDDGSSDWEEIVRAEILGNWMLWIYESNVE